jgi:hypothetical protein
VASEGISYTRDVGPGDRDVRVSVRRHLPEGGLGDVLGDLLEWADVVVIRRKDGSEVRLDPATIVAAKRVPPAPQRRR